MERTIGWLSLVLLCLGSVGGLWLFEQELPPHNVLKQVDIGFSAHSHPLVYTPAFWQRYIHSFEDTMPFDADDSLAELVKWCWEKKSKKRPVKPPVLPQGISRVV